MQETDDVGGGEGIQKCPNTNIDSYCCVDGTLNACNCTSGSGALRFQGTPSVLTTIGFTPSTTSSSSTSTQISSSSSSSHVTTSATIPSLTISPISSASDQATPSPSPSTVNSAAIGAGVGIPVGLLIIGATVFFFHRSRKNREPTRAPIPQFEGYEMGSGRPESPKFQAYSDRGNGDQRNEMLGNTGEFELSGGQNTNRYELHP